MDHKNQDPHDKIYQDQLTEERSASPNAREDVAHSQRLDPDGDPEEARKLIKGEKDCSTA